MGSIQFLFYSRLKTSPLGLNGDKHSRLIGLTFRVIMATGSCTYTNVIKDNSTPYKGRSKRSGLAPAGVTSTWFQSRPISA